MIENSAIMGIIIVFLVIFGLPLLFLIMTYTIRTIIRRRHLKRLAQREKQDIAMTNLKRPLAHWQVQETLGFCSGSVVLGLDSFATFLTNLKKLIGGRMRSYEEIIDRARREALVRLAEEARQMGANAVINIRLETTTLAQNVKGNSAFVEVLAYGTALKVRNLQTGTAQSGEERFLKK